MNIFKNKFNKKAFTLIEMLLVLLIISLLLILIIPNIAKQSSHIQTKSCEAQLKMIDSQIEAYSLKFNKKPSTMEELVNEGYIKENQKQCKSGALISIDNGEAVAS
ncbi:competence type IV pilus major pilin ComGC [Staphylococcus shinii]|jgi:competence protein ComGC|uniref:competence type IV pilus major pilin ComGC n=6 Tax=Staphylococcus TaxID=1279 RepID=UPI00057BFB25|nr:competence type IV pilus major pilin ComGC [Staphylococcus shinii]MDW8565101.1 competence type IV pilus major pilin ComGC [Staphylococcus shinii]MDW8568344.1 competence type IV pilus major pilin ComGC [Staphylococcus shinii]MDW8571128.1 competence type IV pilus major pilin ComGC [Staphylococcus shinii]MDW8572966.1 competence type IV pilus major pilin ComGC [Staphylococcus shinii]MEC5300022.1 prepilin-type N-terminal cleavage/methylation domain-containing protein [Staphylococcus shinii]